MTTPHSADALKPCPFCGDEMKIDTGAVGFATGPGEVYVICDCGAMGAGGANQDDAIAAWNRRVERGLHFEMIADAEGKRADEWRERALRAEAAAGAVPDGYVLVPVEPPLAMAKAFRDADTSGDRFLDGYAAMLAAAPPAQGLPAAPDDPMDWRLPCDVKVGAGTHKKGTTLRSLVSRMEMLHGMAMKAHPVDDAKAAEFRAFLDQQFGSSPPAAAPSEPVADARLDLLNQVDSLCSQIEESLYAFRDDAEARRKAQGAIDHAKKVVEPYRWNGATPPAQDAGTGDATIVAIGYESGFMATDPDHDGATVKLHYRDEATAEAAFCAITRIIDRAIANSGRTE